MNLGIDGVFLSNNKSPNTEYSKQTGFLSSLKIIFRSRNFVVILLTNYTGSLFFAAWIYLNLFFRDVGISYFELGLANSWSMVIGLFATMTGGYWADKHIPHRKYMASFNKFFIAIAAFFIPFTTDLVGLFVVWTVFGFGQFCQSSIDPILFESLPSDQMGTGTSLFTLGGVFGIAGLIFVGILIHDNFVSGLRIFWFLAGLSSFIDFIIRLVFLIKTHPPQLSNMGKKTFFSFDLFNQYLIGFKVLVSIIPLFLIIFLLDATSDLSYNFAQLFFLNEEVGLGYTAINYTMIGATILGVIGAILAGRFLDHTENEAKVMFLAYSLLPISVLILFYSPVIPKWINIFPVGEFWDVISSTAFIAVLIKSGNDVIWRTIAWGAVGRNLPREHTGKVMAILSMAVSLLGIVLNPLIGYIYQIEGGYLLLASALVINLVILCVLFSAWMLRLKKSVDGQDTFRKPSNVL